MVAIVRNGHVRAPAHGKSEKYSRPGAPGPGGAESGVRKWPEPQLTESDTTARGNKTGVVLVRGAESASREHVRVPTPRRDSAPGCLPLQPAGRAGRCSLLQRAVLALGPSASSRVIRPAADSWSWASQSLRHPGLDHAYDALRLLRALPLARRIRRRHGGDPPREHLAEVAHRTRVAPDGEAAEPAVPSPNSNLPARTTARGRA